MTRNLALWIAALRASKLLTPLQKDILDTWDALNEELLDLSKAQAQMRSNNISYPDMILTIGSMPGVVYKTEQALTEEDIAFYIGEAARNNHRYVNLLYQMRSKLVHELHITGTGINFSETFPQVASGVSIDVDDNDNIITTHEASLNIPEKFIVALTWETVMNYLDACEHEGRNPIPKEYSKRKSRLSWYD